MKFDLISTDTWYSLGEKLNETLGGASNNQSVRAYRGLYSALYEVAASLGEAFPHKRSIGVIRGASPLLDPLLAGFSRQGYNIHQIDQSELRSPEDFSGWLGQCNKDLLFVLSAEDHPITAEYFGELSKDSILNEKKVFSITLSHSKWLRDQSETASFAAKICSVNPDLAIVQFGGRVKPAQLVCAQQFWNVNSTVDDIQKIKAQFFEKKDLILKFESELQQPWIPLLKGENRIFDRTVFYSTEIHGEFFLQQMRDLGILEHEIETTNLCRWQGVPEFTKWWSQTPKAEMLRGLVVISSAALERPDFKENFKKATERCLKSSERK